MSTSSQACSNSGDGAIWAPFVEGFVPIYMITCPRATTFKYRILSSAKDDKVHVCVCVRVCVCMCVCVCV
jgi:hypothetical protein